MDKILLGIDIGGTNLKVGRVENGIIVKNSFSIVDTEATKEETLSSLFNLIDSIFDSSIDIVAEYRLNNR